MKTPPETFPLARGATVSRFARRPGWLLVLGSAALGAVLAGCASSARPEGSSASPGEVTDRVALERVTGVATQDPVVQGASGGSAYVAWATLELKLESPEPVRGKILRLVSSEDFAVKKGDRVEVDLRGAPVSRTATNGLEVAGFGMKGLRVLAP